ncbi:hypothetical protein SprV_0702411800 [Sparganum proliferum]
MGLFGHMRICERGIDRSLDTLSTTYTSTMPSLAHVPSPSASTINSSTTAIISKTDTDTADFPCPHYPRAFTSLIGLVGHLRIHRTETGEPVPGALTYTRRIRVNCLHCIHTFANHMGLLGIHETLR